MADEVTETQSPTPTPTPTATSSLPPGSIVVSQEEWMSLRSDRERLSQVERDKQAEIDAKERERLAAVADKEGAQTALDQQRATWETKLTDAQNKAQQIERKMLDANRSTVIAQALAGRTFAGETQADQAEAASQLRSLLEREIEASLDASGNVVVRDRATGRDAGQVLRELLDSRKFAHFLAPRGGNGTGGGGGDRGGSREESKKPEPGSFEEFRDEWVNRRKPQPPIKIKWGT